MILIGADHAGWELKEKLKTYLIKCNYDIVDVGAYEFDEEDDFSKFVANLKLAFDNGKDTRIIAICGSGVGMCIGLNKIKGVRCAVGHTEKEIELAREHNDINALALGSRTTSLIKAKKMIEKFLKTKSIGGKYKRRMDEIELK